jgi:hypothetical protein
MRGVVRAAFWSSRKEAGRLEELWASWVISRTVLQKEEAGSYYPDSTVQHHADSRPAELGDRTLRAKRHQQHEASTPAPKPQQHHQHVSTPGVGTVTFLRPTKPLHCKHRILGMKALYAKTVTGGSSQQARHP